MNLEIVQALHRLQSTIPYAYVVFLCTICILATWRITLLLCRRDHERWMHLHGEAVSREKLLAVRAERDQLKKELARLTERLRSTSAAIRGLHMALGKVNELLQLAGDNAQVGGP